MKPRSRGSSQTLPHLVLVGVRPEIVGKMLGVPVVISVISRSGTNDAFERTIALRSAHADITDPAALLACARELHSWRSIDAMLAGTERALLPTAIVAAALGIRSNPVGAVRLALDKAAMRRRLARDGLATAAFRVCSDVSEVTGFLGEHPGGIILKPADGHGGRGVILVRDRAEIPSAWAHVTGEASAAGVLAEELIPGLELSAETMSAAGEHRVLVIPAKHTSGPPHFVEVAHEVPGGHPPTVEAAASKAVLAALTAVGHAWGPADTEVIVHRGKGTVVEINPRWAGARYWEMIELAVGVDMARACALALCYGELPEPRVTGRGYAVRLLTPSPGRVVSVTGVDQATALDGVIRVGELNRIGDVVPPLTDARGRTGYVLTTGPDPGIAHSLAAEAARTVVLQTVPVVSAASRGTEAITEDVRPLMRELLRSARPDLEQLIRMPPVNGDSGRGAAHAARLFADAGALSVRVIDDADGSPPAVLARYPAPRLMPTVLRYGRYDVPSAHGMAGIAPHLAALRFFGGRPPVGVTVIAEARGQAGSPGLSSLLDRYREELDADVIPLADEDPPQADFETACVKEAVLLIELGKQNDPAQPARFT